MLLLFNCTAQSNDYLKIYDILYLCALQATHFYFIFMMRERLETKEHNFQVEFAGVHVTVVGIVSVLGWHAKLVCTSYQTVQEQITDEDGQDSLPHAVLHVLRPVLVLIAKAVAKVQPNFILQLLSGLTQTIKTHQ